ncbi:hypothetical protein SAMN05428974_1496 [Sphingopyxis sp. YR583]|uniref:hypothetical protein n=1 Tax=Sphingopyxis sp. YR583 TaxID=1881047 RepID=UPI0008A7D5CA|nr:hypothetical protein [Sphingopyxis sp. YR583]SEH15681.1 hypothetical protein SAMN05428974_1496 [Sphingopyxis sp. YR583]
MVSREDLYQLVWSEPISKIAVRFDVSGSYLARICTLLNVPRPERGYWAKLAVGKAPPQCPLPEALPGDPIEWSQNGAPVRTPRPKIPAPRQPKSCPVRISRTQTHGLLHGAKLHFQNGRPVDEGSYLRPFKRLLLDLNASQASLDKALGFANDLFNALSSVGHRVVLAPSGQGLRRASIEEREVFSKPRDHWHYGGLWSPARPTVVYIGTVAIGLAVVEMSETALLRYINGKYIRDSDSIPARGRNPDHSWTTTRDIPSGRMRLVAYSPYQRVSWSKHWQDTKTAAVGGEIRSIVEEIEASARELVVKLEEAECQAAIRQQEWIAEEERRKRVEDRRRIEQSVTDSQSELRDVINQWSNVVSTERFLAGVEDRSRQLPEEEQAEILERLALAREFLGSQDPLDLIRNWKMPSERYKPRYSADNETHLSKKY